MAKRYKGGRKGGRGGGYKSYGYGKRPQRRMSGRTGRSGSRGSRAINVTLQLPPQFYTGGQMPGQPAAPVGFGPDGLMVGVPKGAPKKARF